jgi:ribokinase
LSAPTSTVPAPDGDGASGGGPPVVVVVGDVMVDVVARPAGPLVAGGDTAAAITVGFGGSAANLAVAAARAGAEVHLVAAVGHDGAGRSAADALVAAGVQVHLTRSRRPTGTVVTLVDADGQRTMLSDRGANLDLGAGAVPADLLAPGHHLHLSGYVLLDQATRPAGLAALGAAMAAGMTRSLDPSAAPPGPADVGRWVAVVEGAEWCCVNLAEGRALTGAESPEDVAAALAAHFGQVTVTLGPAGVVVAGGEAPPECFPAPAATVLDTTGAGDAFAGTWLARRLAGDDVGSAARLALAAASAAVGSIGAGWGRYSAV